MQGLYFQLWCSSRFYLHTWDNQGEDQQLVEGGDHRHEKLATASLLTTQILRK